MYTVGKFSLVAAIAALLVLGSSAHAKNMTEPEAPKAKKTSKSKAAKPEAKVAKKQAATKKVAETAKEKRAEQLRSVIDPSLGFGLEPSPEPQLQIKTRAKKLSKKARRRAAKRAEMRRTRRRDARMKAAMSVELGARDGFKRTRAEETMVLEEQRLSDEQVRNSIANLRDSVDVCIERAAAAHGKAPRGHANISFTVEPRGHVTGIRVTAGGPKGKRLSRCMKRAISRWKFPSSDAATEVELPFVLDIAGTAME